MKIISREVQSVEVVSDIICNNCGVSCKTKSKNYEGLIEVSVVGGYDSEHIGDYHELTFSICEKCLMEIINSFKIFPVESYII